MAAERYYLSVYDEDEENWESVNDEFMTLEAVQREIDLWVQQPHYRVTVIKGSELIVETKTRHQVTSSVK